MASKPKPKAAGGLTGWVKRDLDRTKANNVRKDRELSQVRKKKPQPPGQLKTALMAVPIMVRESVKEARSIARKAGEAIGNAMQRPKRAMENLKAKKYAKHSKPTPKTPPAAKPVPEKPTARPPRPSVVQRPDAAPRPTAKPAPRTLPGKPVRPQVRSAGS